MDYSAKKGVTLEIRKNRAGGNWVASIGVAGIDKKTKNYSVRKYGNEKAQKMAFYQRMIFEVERNKKSNDYYDFCNQLFKQILDDYGYELSTDDNGIMKVTNRDTTFVYSHIEEALIDWYETLEESDKCSVEENVPMYWKEEREFITALINQKENNKNESKAN